MTYDPFGGDDSLGAWLFDLPEYEGKKRRERTARQGESAPDDTVRKNFLETFYPDEIDPDDEE